MSEQCEFDPDDYIGRKIQEACPLCYEPLWINNVGDKWCGHNGCTYGCEEFIDIISGEINDAT